MIPREMRSLPLSKPNDHDGRYRMIAVARKVPCQPFEQEYEQFTDKVRNVDRAAYGIDRPKPVYTAGMGMHMTTLTCQPEMTLPSLPLSLEQQEGNDEGSRVHGNEIHHNDGSEGGCGERSYPHCDRWR